MIVELNKEDKKNIDKLNSSFGFVLNNVYDDINNNPFSRYLVYLLDEKIIGYLNYYYIYDRIEIANFNVLEKYQKNGYGKSLLEYLISKYENVVKNITLEVRIDNQKAISLYEKEGFRKVGMRKNYYEGIDGILMEKSFIK